MLNFCNPYIYKCCARNMSSSCWPCLTINLFHVYLTVVSFSSKKFRHCRIPVGGSKSPAADPVGFDLACLCFFLYASYWDFHFTLVSSTKKREQKKKYIHLKCSTILILTDGCETGTWGCQTSNCNSTSN